MPRRLICGLFPIALAFSAAAGAQPVAEVVDGDHRLCVYGGMLSNSVDDRANRVARIGRDEACPQTAPALVTGRPPPTATLLSDSVEAGGRTCVYQEVGSRWRLALPIEHHCPYWAGMLDQIEREIARGQRIQSSRRLRTQAPPL